MLPAANIHLKGLYDTTVEFFALRSPTFSFRGFSTDSNTSSEPTSPTDADLTPVRDPIAKLTRECANLREKLAAAENRHCADTCYCRFPDSPASSSTISSMRRDHDATKNDLSRSQAEVSKLEERCRLLDKTLTETRDILRARDAELERLRSSGGRSSIERRQSQTIDGYQRQLSETQIQKQPSEASQITSGHQRRASGEDDLALMESASTSSSEEDRAQLRGLETFLTKTDRWSGAQVIQAVHDLNSEILQFAASATELCTFEKFSRSSPTKTAQATQDTTSRLGPPLARILSSRDHTQDPLLVQLSLQGCISICIARALSTFCLGFQTKSNSILSQIYNQMRSSEPQPTSSRWRALTHRHIHNLHPDLEDFAVNDLIETIFRWSADVFIISGASNSETVASTREGSLRSRFGAQVRRIAKAVYKLAEVTREEIMSTNFEVVAVENGETYDGRTMVDAFGDYGTSRGAILCTTELGLRCMTRKSVGNGYANAEGGFERRLLLQPKVVLESVVEVIDPK